MSEESAIDFNSASIPEIAEAVLSDRDIQVWSMPLHEMISKLSQLQVGFGPNAEISFGADYERNIYLRLEPEKSKRPTT